MMSKVWLVTFSQSSRLITVTMSVLQLLFAGLSNSTGLLLLCEVAAKPFHEENTANYDADRACKANKKL